ncbi:MULTISPECIES: helix-turn-helix transcriptional regulator [unclassified Neptuniibacter]|uniref:helix-turn-helix domain-containing protein n=1 Tax=unclassified Neptuniibacter TaxID=2630693 RepID=UPI000C563E12|nr:MULTISPECIES: helix-turn-helix transcriptional regulator [unclassified Neptuniibacter]MAY43579.1 transcriptional regulator [Oceanospirillaceae bacterium]|tara:strand:+ start:36020 stop:36751 length:732 start_codon:yes stop_codon:yes gene_type:complete
MAQAGPLIETLKRELKAQGKTYVDVANVLDLSEASVKRLFADKNFTLQRIELICDMLNLEFSELVQRMSKNQCQLIQLSREQEKEIASDLILLLITVSVISGMSYEEILHNYNIPEADGIQKLAKLDRLKIIDLLPNNRVKLLVAPNFHWLPNGPIQQFFQEKVEQDFFSSRFDKANEKLIVSNAILTDSSNARLQKKMERLASEFNDLMQEDQNVPADKKSGTTMVLAIRQWQYSLFKKITK